MNDEVSISRRSFLKKALAFCLGMAATAAAAGVYAGWGERFWVQLKRVALAFPSLPQEFHGMRIVQLSDIHLGHHLYNRHLEELIDRVNRLEADLFVFTGDLYDSRSDHEKQEEVVRLLGNIRAPLGKWAVLGNHDYWGYRRMMSAATVTSILQQAGFQVLVNESRLVTRGQALIRIAGVDDMVHGEPDAVRALGPQAGGANGARPFTLLLAHEPEFADIAAGYGADLQLSGHTHGGQVRLPFAGAVFLPEYGAKYVQGLHRIGPDDKQLLVYTNRGIGTTILPVRFLCRPEATLFTLRRGPGRS
ncbi:metallophosphoesterase [Paenibacillus cymbidii]|uniref:metallophosphoesterase n=1 Tax=Paenibacillus cymbidii TaxID=1639034 RepID=UPI0022A80BA8|nr:metallophosphoesterase [Paenibacillus cymbidii]